MKNKLYQKTLRDLKVAVDNVWDLMHLKRSDDSVQQINICIPIEMLMEITDRAVIRAFESASDMIEASRDLPTLSRASASRLLHRSPKTLREWEEKKILVPVYIDGCPYYRQCDIEALAAQKGGSHA